MRMLAREPASQYPTADKEIAACSAASLRGRSELVRLLAKRFRHEVAARGRRTGSRSKNQVSDTRQSGRSRLLCWACGQTRKAATLSQG